MEIRRRWRVVQAVVGLCVGLVLWRVPWGERTPRIDNDALTDLSSRIAVRQSSRRPLASPDGRYLARSDSVGDVEELISVTDTRTERTTRLVTIREADPYSGRSFVLGWSRVSGALLILGSGSLDGRDPMPLCLVYRMSTDDLLMPAQCPILPAGAAR